MNEEKNLTWGTEREIAFINGLGEHCNTLGNEAKIPSKERIESLLISYAKTMWKRSNWGQIKKKSILNALNLRLSKIRGGVECK